MRKSNAFKHSVVYACCLLCVVNNQRFSIEMRLMLLHYLSPFSPFSPLLSRPSHLPRSPPISPPFSPPFSPFTQAKQKSGEFDSGDERATDGDVGSEELGSDDEKITVR